MSQEFKNALNEFCKNLNLWDNFINASCYAESMKQSLDKMHAFLMASGDKDMGQAYEKCEHQFLTRFRMTDDGMWESI